MADEAADQLARALQQTRNVLANVSHDQMTAATPCEKWDVRTLVDHLIGATEMFSVLTRGDEWTGGTREDQYTSGDFVAAFDDAHRALTSAWQDPAVWSREIHFPFAVLPAQIGVNVELMEIVTHTWDLARATGQDDALDDSLAETVLSFAPMMVPDEVRNESGDPFKPVVAEASDANPWTRLAGAMGRTP